MRQPASILAGLLLLAAARPGLADETLNYTVYLSGDPIGHDSYDAVTAGNVTTLHVDTETNVRVLFIPYHFRHTRTEEWRDGQLKRIVSDTNEDGEVHHLEVHREDGSIIAVIDGRRHVMPRDASPLSLWTTPFVPGVPLFDVTDSRLLTVGFEDRGFDKLTVGGRQVLARHVHLTGDEHWDIWYGPDGMPVKTAFRRSGFPISFVRQ